MNNLLLAITQEFSLAVFRLRLNNSINCPRCYLFVLTLFNLQGTGSCLSDSSIMIPFCFRFVKQYFLFFDNFIAARLLRKQSGSFSHLNHETHSECRASFPRTQSPPEQAMPSVFISVRTESSPGSCFKKSPICFCHFSWPHKGPCRPFHRAD